MRVEEHELNLVRCERCGCEYSKEAFSRWNMDSNDIRCDECEHNAIMEGE